MRGKVDRLTLTALRAPVLLEVTREWRLGREADGVVLVRRDTCVVQVCAHVVKVC